MARLDYADVDGESDDRRFVGCVVGVDLAPLAGRRIDAIVAVPGRAAELMQPGHQIRGERQLLGPRRGLAEQQLTGAMFAQPIALGRRDAGGADQPHGHGAGLVCK